MSFDRIAILFILFAGACSSDGNVTADAMAPVPFDAAATSPDAVAVSDAATGPDAAPPECEEYAWSFRLIGGELQHMATDSDGNVFVAGRVTGPFVDWGGGALAELGDDDIAIAKYDTNGEHLWSRRFGGAGRDYVEALAVGPDGSVVIAGLFNDTATFGGDPMIPSAEFDAFVAKLSPSGEHVWSRQLAGPDVQAFLHVAVANSGAVALAGTYETSTEFAGTTYASDGASDSFVAVYSEAGDEQWLRPIGADTSVLIGGIAASNDVVVVGRFNATIDLGGGPVESLGGHDLFLASYDLTGGYSWSRVFGADVDEFAAGVAIDRASKDVIAVGSFRGTADFGGGDVMGISTSEQFVARYDSDGAFEWVFTLRNAQTHTVSFGPSGRVIIAGEHTSADFGGGLIVATGDRPNVFVAGYDSDGAHLWSHGYGDVGGGAARAASTDATGCTVIAGQFMFGIDFGQGELTPFGGVSEAGFVAQVEP